MWIVKVIAYGIITRSKFRSRKKAHEYANIMRPQYPRGAVQIEKVRRRG